MSQEMDSFESLKDAFKGVTFGGGMRRYPCEFIDKMTIADVMPQELPKVYGSGKSKLAMNEKEARKLYGRGAAVVFDPDTLSFGVHLDRSSKINPRDALTTLSNYFAKAGITVVAANIDDYTHPREIDLEVKLPLTDKAFAVGHALAMKMKDTLGK